MTHTEAAASTAGIITAVHISDLSNGPDGPLFWNYAVGASAAECLAATQKWIEAHGIEVDDVRRDPVAWTITVTIVNASNSAAVTSQNAARTIGASHFVVGEHPKDHIPNTRLDENCSDTRGRPIVDARADLGSIAPLIGSGAANEGRDSAVWAHRQRDVSRTNFLIAFVIAFYTVATAVSLYLAADGNRDAIGYLASLFVFGSFGCRTMVPLRLLALASNVAFMTYAVRNQLAPVLVLHALLLPTNIVRLWQILATRRLASYLPHLSRGPT